MSNKKIVFYIVRHGQTLFNKFYRMQGYSDAPLTEAGIEVAEYAAEGMKNIEFSAAYSSTSERAIDTAQIILNDRDLDLITMKGLKEMFFGDVEGEFVLKVREEYPGLIESLHDGDKNCKFPNGESLEDLVKRLRKAYDEIVEDSQSENSNILVVSHGTAIVNFIRSVKPDIEIKEQLQNCSVTIVTWENGEYNVEEFGLTRYIEEGKIKS